MGICVNPGNIDFAKERMDEFYIDKSGLIQLTNSALGSNRCRIVVSRPRRFGKTTAVFMLEAYYSCGCDSRELFHGLSIENDLSFEKHLNKHNVISLDIQGSYLDAKKKSRLDDFSSYLSETVNAELAVLYPAEVCGHESSLTDSLQAVFSAHGTSFIFLFDEWDVIYREAKHNNKLKEDFAEFLKALFKNSRVSHCVDLAYMTGILPVPKEETQSGLNNFREYTMLEPGKFAEYFGFTEPEVAGLCEKYHMPLQKIRDWYEGYHFGSVGSIYCPSSVVDAMAEQKIQSYWKRTGAASELFALTNAIDPQFQETVRDLLTGTEIEVRIDRDGIDLTDLTTKDSILTALVHLGYLAYREGKVRIPSQEVAEEFFNILRKSENNPAYKIISRSVNLLDKTLDGDADAVAEILEENHELYSSVLTCNRENDLTYLILLSYNWSLGENYTFFREFPAGKGFADIVFLPVKPGKIPIVVEVKWDKNADTAIRQMKEQRYARRFHGDVLLVEISYEKDRNRPDYKIHTCVIERITCP